MNLIKKIVFGIVVLLLLVTCAGYLFLKSKKPVYDGELKLAGLKQPVTVTFDTHGVPHINAQSEEDLYRAFGYIHASERLWQMDLIRRVGDGRLSELLGEATVDVDKFFRTLRIKELGDKNAAEAVKKDEAWVKAANAYYDGVNQYIKEGKLPAEYTLIGAKPELFKFSDMYKVLGFMSFSFAMATRTEPIANFIHQKYGTKYLYELALDWEPGMQKIPLWYPEADSLTEISTAVTALLDQVPAPIWSGSNGWVVSGTKSASGKPLFANDPHIAYSQPGVWYEAHLEAPDYHFYGQHLAGFPFAIIGHTNKLGWGFTMFENDDMDMYIEKADPSRPDVVLNNDQYQPLAIHDEVIKVKGAKDITIQVKVSHHGSIINDVIKDLSAETNPISLFWVYNEFENRVPEATYKLNHAANFEDTKAASALVHAPGLNLMYGDVDGNIAWMTLAKIPRRNGAQNSKLFLNGSNGEDEVLYYYNFEDNPQSINPPSGFVFSANNQPDSMRKNSYIVPGYYVPEDRARRISTALESKNGWTVEDFQALIMDSKDLNAEKIIGIILPIIDIRKELVPSDVLPFLHKLRTWDYMANADQPEPVVYHQFIAELSKAIFMDELGEERYKAFIATHLFKCSLVKVIGRFDSPWWDDLNTPEKEIPHEVVIEALKRTAAVLTERYGANTDEYKWSDMHILEHGHALGKQKPLDKIFNVGPFGSTGSTETINNVMFTPYGDEKAAAVAGPSMRLIIDFADPETAWNVQPTGQSGMWGSPFYSDQAELYNAGKWRGMYMKPEDIKKNAYGVLVLKP